MLTVVAPLQLVVASMMLRGEPPMKSPVIPARQTIFVRPVVPPLHSIMLPIVAIFQAIMATIMGGRITVIGHRRRGQPQCNHRQQRLDNVSSHLRPPLELAES
jgi:hypothetical protein